MESPAGAIKFSSNKCFSIVRNPIDLIPSLALLMNTTSHSKTTTVPLNEADPEWWDKFVKSLTKMCNDNMLAMKEQLEPAIPTMYIRYEDMVLNPEPILIELFCFLLNVPSIEGTVVEKRIKDYCAKGSSAASVYKLKADPRNNLSRNAGMFTDEQI